ncbi:MAG: hypothetical protein WA874_02940 [Chryseosolibacter sp.]
MKNHQHHFPSDHSISLAVKKEVIPRAPSLPGVHRDNALRLIREVPGEHALLSSVWLNIHRLKA